MNFFKFLFFFTCTGVGLSAKIQFVHRTNDWATHQPVLYEMAMRTEGAIIEFGCGYNSTEMLHEICKASGRTLISIEDDREWINKFMEMYKGDGYEEDNSGWHKFYYVPGKLNVENDTVALHWIQFLDHFSLLETMKFDLAFVDQSPGRARTETIHRIKDKIKFIILHDCDCYASNELGICYRPIDGKNQIPGIFDFSQTFAHFKVFFPLHPWPGQSGPPTLLGSNFEDVPDIDYKNY